MRIKTTVDLFQVFVPTAGVRGFLDASDYETWIKHVQSNAAATTSAGQNDELTPNVKHILLGGQVSSHLKFKYTLHWCT